MLKTALSQYGQREVAGENDNPNIVTYAKETGSNWVANDEVPWCSTFINWVAKKAGYEYTHKANARSWMDIGKEIKNPETGDIVVFKRGSNPTQGHVGLYINSIDEIVYVLGGNQSDMVRISAYNKKNVLGYRRLSKLK